MLFSIIIPVYNAEKYIAESIQSVLNQKYTDLQLVIVDDGSNDKSAEIIKSIQAKDDRIIYTYQENSGVSSARNSGKLLAKGEYLIFMDADDKLHNEALEKIADVIHRTSCDIVLYNTCRSDFGNNPFEPFTTPFENKEFIIDSLAKKKKYIYSAFTSDKIIGIMGNFAVKSKILQDINFRTDMVIYEDMIFDIQMYEKAQTIVCIPDYLYFYRNNPESAVNKFNYKKIEDLKIAYCNKLKLIEKYSLDKDVIRLNCWMLQELVYYYYKQIENKTLCREYIGAIKADDEINNILNGFNKKEIGKHVELYKCLFGNSIEQFLYSTYYRKKKLLKALLKR